MRVISAAEAAMLIKDGDTVSIIGNGGDVMVPEKVYEALEERFLESQAPKNLTLIHSSGIGDQDVRGINRFTHDGMVKRVIGGHWDGL